MKNLLLILLFFNFSSIANASVDEEFESEPAAPISVKSLITMTHGQVESALHHHAHKSSLAIQFADLRLTDDVYGIHGLVGRVMHKRTYWNPFLYKISFESYLVRSVTRDEIV